MCFAPCNHLSEVMDEVVSFADSLQAISIESAMIEKNHKDFSKYAS